MLISDFFQKKSFPFPIFACLTLYALAILINGVKCSLKKHSHFCCNCFSQDLVNIEIQIIYGKEMCAGNHPLSISTWFLKYRVSLDFFFNFEISGLKNKKINLILKLIFAGYTGSKNQVWTWKKIKFDSKSFFFSL